MDPYLHPVIRNYLVDHARRLGLQIYDRPHAELMWEMASLSDEDLLSAYGIGPVRLRDFRSAYPPRLRHPEE